MGGHGKNKYIKQSGLSFEVKLCQGITRQRRGNDHTGSNQKGNNRAVEKALPIGIFLNI